MFLTAGAFGIWTIIDFILICSNRFTDFYERPIDKPCNLLVVILAIGFPMFLIVGGIILIILLAAASSV
jgi:hypothetical protein